jgi:putative ABC transport system permease protein
MRALQQDIAYFWRSFARTPGFFGVVVLTLALGIGANTAIFSVINAVLLRPLPFRNPDRLVRLFETEAAPGNYPFAGPDYLDWQAQNRALEKMSLFRWYRRSNISGSGQPESALTTAAEASFFDVLGVRPLMGRTFAPAESVGNSRVAVISYGFWQRHFGGDRAVLNRTVEIDSVPHAIVGVMPRWFDFPRDVEIWTPLDMSPERLGPRGSHSYQAIARLRPGETASRALADLAAIASRLEQQFPNSNHKVGAAVVPLGEQMTRGAREPLLILLGAVALVLLVACANVANLLLIRAGGRRREVAIRTALGAGRWRIVRQMLTESVLLATAGAATGLAAAWWLVRLLPRIKSLPIPLPSPVTIDAHVLLFALGAALLTGFLFGVLPAWQASSLPVGEELKAGSHAMLGTGARARRLRDAIAVAEIALSLALLVGAGLLLRSFQNLRQAEFGAGTRNVLTATVSLPAARYTSEESRRAFLDRLLERLRTSPGIVTAALSTQIPLEGGSNGFISVPGQDDSRLRNQLFEWNYVSAGYLRTFGIPLLQGRLFDARDEDDTAAVALKVNEAFAARPPRLDLVKGATWPAVVNRTMARLVWPGQDAIGKQFVMGDVITALVVGVAADVKVRGLRSQPLPQAYFPFTGALDGPWSFRLTVRTAGSPASALGPMRAHVAALDSTLAVIDPRTLDEVVSDGMRDTNLQAWLLGTFAALAAVLAAVGLYSVMAFLVAQRRHEIGIRVALGAGHAALLRLVLGHGARLVAAGVLAGLGAAYWLTRLIRGLLYGVAPNDAATFAMVAGLLILIALAACAVPARRAMRVDPIIALRYE